MAPKDSTLVVLLLALACTTVTAFMKKGVSVNPRDYKCNDLSVLDNIGWWYDWGGNRGLIERESSCDVSAHINKYVPMIWGYNPKWFTNYWLEDSPFVLAFNEPNHGYQSNLSPAQAVEGWPTVEHYANGRTIISPAVAPCGSNCQTPSGVNEWFDLFFKELCNSTSITCGLEYIATHHYPQYKDGKPNSCNAFKTMNYLTGLYQAYGKKIWLTEFACAQTTDPAIQLKYMKEILPQLEESEMVYAYSWYVTRSQAPDTDWVTASADLFEADSSTLTPLGEFYNSFISTVITTTTSSTSTTSTTSSTTSSSTTSSSTSSSSSSTTTASSSSPSSSTKSSTLSSTSSTSSSTKGGGRPSTPETTTQKKGGPPGGDNGANRNMSFYNGFVLIPFLLLFVLN